MELQVLKAHNGDSLILSWEYEGKTKNILIDGGTSESYKKGANKGHLYNALLNIKRKSQSIDLLIVTHVDNDHIGGIIQAFKRNELLRELCLKVWFNSGKLIHEHFKIPHDETHVLELEKIKTNTNSDNYTSIRQGVSFEDTIENLSIWHKEIIKQSQTLDFYGSKITILSPTIETLRKLLTKWQKEIPNPLTSSARNDYSTPLNSFTNLESIDDDESIHNGSSIAFLFEYNNKKILFLADAFDKVIVNAINNITDENGNYYSEKNPLYVDYIKLSHHGSSYNTSMEFLRTIRCNNFIISTNGYSHGLPNKLTIARIQSSFPDAKIFFNYENLIDRILTNDERPHMLAKKAFLPITGAIII